MRLEITMDDDVLPYDPKLNAWIVAECFRRALVREIRDHGLEPPDSLLEPVMPTDCVPSEP